MQTVGTKYLKRLGSPQLRPVWIYVFEGMTTRYSTSPVRNPLGETKAFASVPAGAGAQVTIDEGRSSFADVQFDVLDVDGSVLKLLSKAQFSNRLCTIKTGFADMEESDYVVAYQGRVLEYPLQPDNITWRFDLVSLYGDTDVNIFDAFCTLDSNINSVTGTVPVDGVGIFPTATAGVCYLRIDNEVISFTGTTSNSFTGCVRGELGTVAASHNAGAKITNLIVLQGNPLTLALQIMLSTGAGTNGPYDVLPLCASMGIPKEFVDVATFERQRDIFLVSNIFRFEEQDVVSGIKFLQEQVYSFCTSYPVTNNLGQISVKVYGPPLPNQLAKLLTDDNMAGAPSYQGSRLSNYFFNEVDLSFDYNFVTKNFDARAFFDNIESQDTFGTTSTKTLESRGMRSDILLMGLPRIQAWALKFLKRFSTPSPTVNAKTLYVARLVEPGDIVPVTSKYIPDLVTGRRGAFARLMEVVEIRPDFTHGLQQLVLYDTGYTYGRKYAAISPSHQPPINFPVYLSASAEQRNYAFISDKISPTKGVMSNGDDGYYITP